MRYLEASAPATDLVSGLYSVALFVADDRAEQVAAADDPAAFVARKAAGGVGHSTSNRRSGSGVFDRPVGYNRVDAFGIALSVRDGPAEQVAPADDPATTVFGFVVTHDR